MIQIIGPIMSSSAFITVVTGVSVFVAGQLIVKFAIEPYVAFKEQLGRISVLLLRSQDKISNGRADAELIHELKEAAAQLMAKYSALPDFLKKSYFGIKIIPAPSSIHDAAKNLNLFAALLTSREISPIKYPSIKEIGNSLGIPTTYY